jgi:hypothetical protein
MRTSRAPCPSLYTIRATWSLVNLFKTFLEEIKKVHQKMFNKKRLSKAFFVFIKILVNNEITKD